MFCQYFVLTVGLTQCPVHASLDAFLNLKPKTQTNTFQNYKHCNCAFQLKHEKSSKTKTA